MTAAPDLGDFRVLLLDALGTLVALEPPAPGLRAELGARFGVRISQAEAAAAMAAEIAYYRAHMHRARDAGALADLRGRCAAVVREALPDSAELRMVTAQELTEALLGSLRFRAHPDALPALQALSARGLRTAVVSNWDVSLPEVLGRVGLAPWLDVVVTSAEVGAAKPAPRPFQVALERLGASAGEALHVGDSVAEDIAGAQAAGVRAVLLARGQPAPRAPVPVIGSLLDLT